MAYTSQIDLGGLGETPKVRESEMFPDMVDVYNAIHILAQWTESIRENVTQGGGEVGTPPWESLPFRNWVWVQAARNIPAGSIVTMIDFSYFSSNSGQSYYRRNGVILGAAVLGLTAQNRTSSNGDRTPGRNNRYFPRYGGFTGFALEACSAGDMCKVGIGPAIVEVPGLATGESVFAYQAWQERGNVVGSRRRIWAQEGARGGIVRLARNGGNYSLPIGLVQIGVGVAPSAMLFAGPEVPQTGPSLREQIMARYPGSWPFPFI